MNEKEILKVLYTDKCTVYRNVENKGIFDDFKEVILYQDIQCGLSFSKGSTEDLKDIQTINYLATLFLDPIFILKAGDIVVCNDLKFRCGEGVYYSSHAEIPLIKEDVA